MRKLKIGLVALVAAIAVAITAVACETAPGGKKSHEVQGTVLERAQLAVPAYEPQEFSIREDVNRYLQETEGRHTWYTYALNYLGEPLFYIVSDMRPTNICANITSSDTIIYRNGAYAVATAPSLNGIWRKSGACDSFFMFDATTGQYIEISGTAFTLISSKQPMFLETDLRRLGSEEE